MDPDVAVWILDFLLRQPHVPDGVLNSLFSSLPLPSDNLQLSKAVLLRRIETEIAKGTVSDNILDLLELVYANDHEVGVPVTKAMKRAYCWVAVECTVRAARDAEEYFETVKRVWRERLKEMGEGELVSDELVGWRDVFEAAAWNSKAWVRLREIWREGDALGAVSEYVKEAWEGLGPSFIEVVASDAAAMEALGQLEREGEGDFRGGEIGGEDIVCNGDKVKAVLPSVDNEVPDQIPTVNNVMLQRGTHQPRRKHVAKKHSRKSVAGTSRGAKIIDTEQVNQDLSNRYGSLPSPAIVKIQEALRKSAVELHAAVNDPLPEALELAENVISCKNADNSDPVVQENNGDPEKPCTSHQNNAPKSSLMARNSTAQTYEWDDSIDNSPECAGESRSKVNLPTPKNMVVSPLKKHVVKNLRGRRNKKWTLLEEETLRTGVDKYGRGNWKTILNAYSDVFDERTDVDLKDKWRNMTRYSN